MQSITTRVLLATLSLLFLASHAGAQNESIPVELIQTKKNGWELRRGGEPYFVKGGCIVRSGMDDPDLPILLDAIRDSGGNCIRLWSTGPGTGGILDAAHERGLTVMLGLWMLHSDGHADSSGADFDYLDPAAVQDQIDSLALQVNLYRHHPALLEGLGTNMAPFAASWALRGEASRRATRGTGPSTRLSPSHGPTFAACTP